MTEKQQKIVEMAKDICRVQMCCNDVCNPISACDALRYAERAVEAGYVKQSEVAREIIEEIERLITKECLVFKDENGIRGYVDASVHYAIAELKKKYTEGK